MSGAARYGLAEIRNKIMDLVGDLFADEPVREAGYDFTTDVADFMFIKGGRKFEITIRRVFE